MIDISVKFIDRSTILTSDQTNGKASIGTTITYNKDENLNYATLIYINSSPLPFNPGAFVSITIAQRPADNFIITSDEVTITKRNDSFIYKHAIQLVEQTYLLGRVVTSGYSFPRISYVDAEGVSQNKNWTLEEAIRRVLITETVNVAGLGGNVLSQRFFLEDVTSSSIYQTVIPELQFSAGTPLLDILNGLYSLVQRRARLDIAFNFDGSIGRMSVVGLKLNPGDSLADTSGIYNYHLSKSLEDAYDSASVIVNGGIPSGSTLSSARNIANTPRSESIYCSTDDLYLLTDFPIYKINKVYLIRNSNNIVGADYCDVQSAFKVKPFLPASGIFKLDCTKYFVTSDKYSTLDRDTKQFTYYYEQGSNKIPFTLLSSSNPFFPTSKATTMMSKAAEDYAKELSNKYKTMMGEKGYSLDLISGMSWLAIANLIKSGWIENTDAGFGFLFQIDYIPLVKSHLTLRKKGVTNPLLTVDATSNSSPELERQGENVQGVLARLNNPKVFINRIVKNFLPGLPDRLNDLGVVLPNHAEYSLTSNTIVIYQDYLECAEVYTKNFNRRMQYVNVDKAYRETSKPLETLRRSINYYDTTSKTASWAAQRLNKKYLFGIRIKNLAGNYTGTHIIQSASVTKFGITLAFISNLSADNVMGNKVINVDSHKELSPVPLLAGGVLEKQNILEITIYEVVAPTYTRLTSVPTEDFTNGGLEGKIIYLEQDVQADISEYCKYFQMGDYYSSEGYMLFPQGFYILEEYVTNSTSNTGFGSSDTPTGVKADYVYKYIGATEADLQKYQESSSSNAERMSLSRAYGNSFPENETQLSNESDLNTIGSYSLRVDKTENEVLDITIQMPITIEEE